ERRRTLTVSPVASRKKPLRFQDADGNAPCVQRSASSTFQTIGADKRESPSVIDRRYRADLAAGGRDGRSCFGQRRSAGFDRQQLLARSPAMLHPRRQFLSHIAALVEGHAVQLFEVGVEREHSVLSE